MIMQRYLCITAVNLPPILYLTFANILSKTSPFRQRIYNHVIEIVPRPVADPPLYIFHHIAYARGRKSMDLFEYFGSWRKV